MSLRELLHLSIIYWLKEFTKKEVMFEVESFVRNHGTEDFSPSIGARRRIHS